MNELHALVIPAEKFSVFFKKKIKRLSVQEGQSAGSAGGKKKKKIPGS